MADLLDPVTPGELLLEEFLKPMELSQYRLAKEIGVPAQRIGQIVLGRTDGYWLRAQEAYDLEVTRRKIEPELKRIRPWNQAACL